MSRVTRVTFVFFAALTLLGACGGGGQLPPVVADAGVGAVSGVVSIGSVSGSTVTAYALSNGFERGRALGSASVDEAGRFSLPELGYVGNVLLVATGGSYREPAVESASIPFGTDELWAVLSNYEPTRTVDLACLSAVSHLEAVLAKVYVTSRGKSVADALAEARTHLDAHFGNLLWASAVPVDLTAGAHGSLDDGAKAGLVLAGLSWQARMISEADGLSPASQITAMTMLRAYADDLTDGFFDGQGPSGPIVIPAGGVVRDTAPTAYRMDGSTARQHFAQGIQHFISSSRNASGLTAADVFSVADAIARDSNPAIFRTAGSGVDVAPPSVTFAVTFVPTSGGPERTPFGVDSLVSGTVAVTATASDPSGVQSLALFVGDAPLSPEQGNTPARAVGHWASAAGPDGQLTFRAHVVDLNGNAGDATYTVAVDNTVPAIRVDLPAPTFYAAQVPVDATAGDANGVASLTASGFEGLVDDDRTSAHFGGTWNVPAQVPDGAAALNLVACDVVGNCATATQTVTLDRTPPTLEVSGPALPQYAAGTSVTLDILAADGSGAGVAGVFAKVNGGAEIPASAPTEMVPAWHFAKLWLLPDARNTIRVYAKDVLGNSGESSADSPRLLTHDVLVDTSPPAAAVHPFASYRDERQLGLQTDANGKVIAPAQYTFPSDLLPIPVIPVPGSAAVVYKVQTRRGWGPGAPTAAEFETTNTWNTPFVQIGVPFNPNTDAPLVQARYCLGTACGDLLPSPTIDAPNTLYFDLPVSASNVPEIESAATSPITLPVTVTLADAAGNVSVPMSLGSIEYHLVGPPLQAFEDRGYRTVYPNDSRSARYYSFNWGNFRELYATTNPSFTSPYIVRYRRFVVLNPGPEDVVVTVGLTGASDLQDHWTSRVPAVSGDSNGVFTDPLGTTHTAIRNFNASGLSCAPENYPCRNSGSGGDHPYYPMYWNGIAREGCTTDAYPVDGAAETVNISGTPRLVAQGFTPATSYSAEIAVVPSASGPQRFIVPAASGSVPGGLVIYVGRPFGARDELTIVDYGLGHSSIQRWVQDLWIRDWAYQCCLGGCVSFSAHRWIKEMTGQDEIITGGLVLTSSPHTGTFDHFGEGRQVWSSTLDLKEVH